MHLVLPHKRIKLRVSFGTPKRNDSNNSKDHGARKTGNIKPTWLAKLMEVSLPRYPGNVFIQEKPMWLAELAEVSYPKKSRRGKLTKESKRVN